MSTVRRASGYVHPSFGSSASEQCRASAKERQQRALSRLVGSLATDSCAQVLMKTKDLQNGINTRQYFAEKD